MKKNYIAPITNTNNGLLAETFMETMSKDEGASGDIAEAKKRQEEEELEEEEEFIEFIISQESQPTNSLW